jgi:hypothetical protein
VVGADVACRKRSVARPSHKNIPPPVHWEFIVHPPLALTSGTNRDDSHTHVTSVEKMANDGETIGIYFFLSRTAEIVHRMRRRNGYI